MCGSSFGLQYLFHFVSGGFVAVLFKKTGNHKGRGAPADVRHAGGAAGGGGGVADVM